MPLIGVTYDPKSDLVEIALEGLDHMIGRPREIYVQDDAGALASILKGAKPADLPVIQSKRNAAPAGSGRTRGSPCMFGTARRQ